MNTVSYTVHVPESGPKHQQFLKTLEDLDLTFSRARRSPADRQQRQEIMARLSGDEGNEDSEAWIHRIKESQTRSDLGETIR